MESAPGYTAAITPTLPASSVQSEVGQGRAGRGATGRDGAGQGRAERGHLRSLSDVLIEHYQNYSGIWSDSGFLLKLKKLVYGGQYF